jgi:hypothetical protein
MSAKRMAGQAKEVEVKDKKPRLQPFINSATGNFHHFLRTLNVRKWWNIPDPQRDFQERKDVILRTGHQEKITMDKFFCLDCKQEFQASKWWASYCSDVCRQRACRRRKKESRQQTPASIQNVAMAAMKDQAPERLDRVMDP